MEQAPQQNFRIIRKFIPGALHPFVRGFRKRLALLTQTVPEPFRTVYPYTQVNPIRQENLLRLCEEIERNKVPGDVVECGVLDGGTAALMAYGTRTSGRGVHLFDSWEGLPNTTEEDGPEAAVWIGEDVGSPSRVISVMNKLGIEQRRLHFHRGWFDQTFPKASINQIALLHADGDFYASVKLTVETWFPKIAPGGYLQIDDYAAFVGCRRAIDEFLEANPTLKLQTFGEHVKAYFIEKPH
jgi:O-methyltransferase